MMRISIIGGGFCGATIASILDSNEDFSVTLIDRKPFFEYNPSAQKCITKPKYQNRIRYPFNKFLSTTRIISEQVKQIFPSKIQTDSKIIEFDYAVLCMGATYPILLSNTNHVYKMTNCNDAIRLFKSLKEANNVLIVGGGYLGVEIASELATKRPDLDITVVHSQKRLLEKHPKLVSLYTTKFLSNRGVKIILNEKIIEQPKDHSFSTKNGRMFEADVCIWCTGIDIDTTLLKEFNPASFDENNRIKVNEFLQIEGYDRLFAGGDITSINEEKTARNAKLHAHIIANNIKKMYQKKSLVAYKRHISPMVINLGDYRGIATYGDLIFFGILPGISKWIIEWWTLFSLRAKT